MCRWEWSRAHLLKNNQLFRKISNEPSRVFHLHRQKKSAHSNISITAREWVLSPKEWQNRRNCLLTRRRCTHSLLNFRSTMYYPPILRAMLPRINERGTKIKHWLRYVTFPTRRFESRQKSPGGGTGWMCEEDGRRARAVWTSGARDCMTRTRSATFRNVFECVTNGSRGESRYLDNQRELGGRKIYTPRTFCIFNSLALMSLALVAPNWRDSRIVYQDSRS